MLPPSDNTDITALSTSYSSIPFLPGNKNKDIPHHHDATAHRT
jgi:hypothetical protein